jgi:hypothetical protein
MRPKRIIPGARWAFLLTLSLSVLAQLKQPQIGPSATATSTPRSLGLHQMAKIRVPISSVYFEDNTGRCDGSGNIYVRPLPQGGVLGKDRIPLHKITPEGKLAETFQVPLEGFRDRGIFVASNGDVYRMGWEQGTSGSFDVVKFRKNGSVQSTVHPEIEPGFWPQHLAVFPSGELLLSGTVDNTMPKAAVFNAGGKLIKTIYEPEDEEARNQTVKHNPNYLLNPSETRFGVYDEMGDAAVGSDGNVYLLRSAPPALVFVISPKGEVIRKFRVDPGDDGLISSSIWTHSDQLAVAFQPRQGMPALALVKVVDLEGRPVTSYALEHLDPEEVVGDMACYGGQGITFIRPAGTELHLLKSLLK